MDFNAVHRSDEAVEDLAEEYLLGRITSQDLLDYEQHLLVCEGCREAVEQADDFIRMFRRAVKGERAGS